MLNVFVCMAVVALGARLSDAGSCRESKLCCPGRDSSCVVQKAPLNAIIEDLTDKPCYCDHACLKLGDCCSDFKDACGVVDCTVSQWGAWASCSAACGAGSTARERRVERAPARGGRRCPGLAQQRACHATHACLEHDQHALRETAMLLPASLSLSRRVNETLDIRKNLRMRNPNDPENNPHTEYCVEFEIMKASKACHREVDYKSLQEGGRVCVRCEPEALRRSLAWRCSGQGARGRGTRFSALAAPHCHGQWARATPDAPELAALAQSCEACDTVHYIFV